MSETKQDEQARDLDNFKPSPPALRLDDKAAALEAELAGRVAQFNKERFCYWFAIVSLFNILVANNLSNTAIFISVASSLIFVIGIGKWLDFPFIHDRLDRWERLAFEACKRWIHKGNLPSSNEPT
jgi:hypothetical protein